MKAWPLALGLLVACGHGPTAAQPDGPGSQDADAAVDSGVPAGYTLLVSRTWSLQAGQLDTYKCTRVQAPTDMWINAFQLMGPLGTHHEVLTIDPRGTSVGDYDCNVSTGTVQDQLLYAAGVGTDDLAFPAGVAIHLAAGTWINLNLHLFDATDMPLSGESGILVKTISQADVMHEADMVFSGTLNISVPPDNLPHTASGGCAAPTDWHVFSLWPHMHQIGTHQSLTVTHNGTTITPLDADYSFLEQRNYPIAETMIYQGDQVQTTCTYVNTTGATVTYGQSSNDEMCFTGIYKYPAGSTSLGCVSL